MVNLHHGKSLLEQSPMMASPCFLKLAAELTNQILGSSNRHVKIWLCAEIMPAGPCALTSGDLLNHDVPHTNSDYESNVGTQVLKI